MSSCGIGPLSKPCRSCPWRIDQSAADIPNFSLQKAEGLSNTCPDANGFGPEFTAPMFACHQSREGGEFACAGWLAVAGHAHPMVRLAIARGRLPVTSLEPASDWPELHESYAEVISKLRVTMPVE